MITWVRDGSLGLVSHIMSFAGPTLLFPMLNS